MGPRWGREGARTKKVCDVESLGPVREHTGRVGRWNADADLSKTLKNADADLSKTLKNADADLSKTLKNADADLSKPLKNADADLPRVPGTRCQGLEDPGFFTFFVWWSVAWGLKARGAAPAGVTEVLA